MNSNTAGAAVCGFFIGIVACLLVIFLPVVEDFNGQVKALKMEAVKRGHAEWPVDAEGRVSWRWKDAI
jgi:hypothetical protein